MDNQPNFINPAPLEPDPAQPSQPPHKSISHWLIVGIAVAAVVAFFVTSYYYALWPFGSFFPVIPPPPPGSALKTEIYRNEQFGFSIELNENWKGYSVLNNEWEGWNVITGNVAGKGPLIVLRNSAWTPGNPYEDMPVMIFTPEEWDLIQEGTLSVGAAPVPPSLLARNSRYVMALPARYNYDYKTGWEEVEILVHTLQASEPTQTGASTPDLTGWQTYRNEEYGFEFRYPESMKLEVFTGNVINFEYSIGDVKYIMEVWPIPIKALESKGLSLNSYEQGYINGYKTYTSDKPEIFFDPIMIADKNGDIAINFSILTSTYIKEPSNRDIEVKNTFDQILSTFRFIK